MSADNARMLRLRDDDEQIVQPLLASALLTLSMLVVPHMDAIAKYLGMQGHHVLQLTWLRMASQCAIVMPLAVYKHGWRGVLFAPRRRWLLLRGCFLLGATVCFFGSLKWLPLADAVAITFIEPMLLLVFSALVLRERVHRSRACAVVAGFGAVVMIIKPGTSSFRPAGLIAMLAAGFFSLYLLATRQLQLVESCKPSKLMMLAYQCVPGALLLAAVLPLTWSPFASWFDGFLGVSMGAIGAVSHGLLIKAFSLSEASYLAPLLYTEIIMQTVLGYLVWGDLPDAFALAGIILIIAVGIFLGLTERKDGGGREAKATAETAAHLESLPPDTSTRRHQTGSALPSTPC